MEQDRKGNDKRFLCGPACKTVFKKLFGKKPRLIFFEGK